MKLIESKAEYIPQEEGLEGIYKQIERCARTCYKSEDKITDTSAKAFVDRLIASKHLAMLEHGTVYLKIANAYAYNKPKDIFSSGQAISTAMYPWLNTPYCKINKSPSKEDSNVYDAYITTNLRYIWEKELGNMQGIHNEFLMYRCSPTEFHEKRYTFKFTCSRAIANELVRHRVFSFAQESSRYCNYSKGKFGHEITFIEPTWLMSKHSYIQEDFTKFLGDAEELYIYLSQWLKPQEVREVLPLATKTELIMTGFASDWRYLLDVRLYEKTGKVHPDMLDLMQKAQKAMQEAGIWKDIMSYPSKFK